MFGVCFKNGEFIGRMEIELPSRNPTYLWKNCFVVEWRWIIRVLSFGKSFNPSPLLAGSSCPPKTWCAW